MERKDEKLATWNTKNGTISAYATSRKYLGLWIEHDGQLAGCHLSTERAMELVNTLAGETVWR